MDRTRCSEPSRAVQGLSSHICCTLVECGQCVAHLAQCVLVRARPHQHSTTRSTVCATRSTVHKARSTTFSKRSAREPFQREEKPTTTLSARRTYPRHKVSEQEKSTKTRQHETPSTQTSPGPRPQALCRTWHLFLLILL